MKIPNAGGVAGCAGTMQWMLESELYMTWRQWLQTMPVLIRSVPHNVKCCFQTCERDRQNVRKSTKCCFWEKNLVKLIITLSRITEGPVELVTLKLPSRNAASSTRTFSMLVTLLTWSKTLRCSVNLLFLKVPNQEQLQTTKLAKACWIFAMNRLKALNRSFLSVKAETFKSL